MPRITTSLFCEDIRRELGGQASIIGMYSSLLFVECPTSIPISYFVRVTPLPPPGTQVSVRILLDDEQIYLQEATAPEMRYEDKDVSIHSNIVVGPLIVELESPAILSCEIKLGDDMDFVKDYLYIFDKPDPDEGVSDKN